jgi:hypothetical protein
MIIDATASRPDESAPAERTISKTMEVEELRRV